LKVWSQSKSKNWS